MRLDEQSNLKPVDKKTFDISTSIKYNTNKFVNDYLNNLDDSEKDQVITTLLKIKFMLNDIYNKEFSKIVWDIVYYKAGLNSIDVKQSYNIQNDIEYEHDEDTREYVFEYIDQPKIKMNLNLEYGSKYTIPILVDEPIKGISNISKFNMLITNFVYSMILDKSEIVMKS